VREVVVGLFVVAILVETGDCKYRSNDGRIGTVTNVDGCKNGHSRRVLHGEFGDDESRAANLINSYVITSWKSKFVLWKSTQDEFVDTFGHIYKF
jgi:hypothetical protein